MSNGSGLSRGDRNRNARLARLRELVPLSNAIAGIDLADDTQAVVVTDHDSREIARRRAGPCSLMTSTAVSPRVPSASAWTAPGMRST